MTEELSHQEILRRERITTCPLHNCPQHLDEEMELRGTRTGRLLCMKCAVTTPTGYIAKETARAHEDKFFKGDLRDYMLAFALCCFGMALVTAMLVNAGVLMFDWYIAGGLGVFVGAGLAEISLRLSERRRGRYSDLVGAASTVIGGAMGAFGVFIHQGYALEIALEHTLSNIALMVFIGAAAAAAYAHFKGLGINNPF